MCQLASCVGKIPFGVSFSRREAEQHPLKPTVRDVEVGSDEEFMHITLNFYPLSRITCQETQYLKAPQSKASSALPQLGKVGKIRNFWGLKGAGKKSMLMEEGPSETLPPSRTLFSQWFPVIFELRLHKLILGCSYIVLEWHSFLLRPLTISRSRLATAPTCIICQFALPPHLAAPPPPHFMNNEAVTEPRSRNYSNNFLDIFHGNDSKGTFNSRLAAQNTEWMSRCS
ncbi:hypothetical protein BT69DRAFT_1315101 [Atractiella rhizophila]|nr:hypothetical protein BT69DRAFT_1315101 [Atractiella rhizophila]